MNFCERGFTLIEIMVSIAIITILVAIAIPAYQNYVIEAQSNACLYEVKSYSNDVFTSLNDDDESTMPIIPIINSCESITDASSWQSIEGKIVAYAKSPSNAYIECNLPKGPSCFIIK